MGVSIDNWSWQRYQKWQTVAKHVITILPFIYSSINHVTVPIALIGISCLLVTVSKVETGELEDGEELPPNNSVHACLVSLIQ